MTLYSWGNPRYFPSLPPPTRRYFDVAARRAGGRRLPLAGAAWEHPTLLALHGLNGSSEAHYMKGLASKAFARGMNVLRLNQRNCGDTEHLAAGLFHSGLTTDAAHVDPRVDDGRRPAGDRGFGLFAGRQPGAEAGRRVRRASAEGVRRRGGGVADHRDRRVHARARTPRERAVSMELRQGSEAADAAQGAVPPWPVRSERAGLDQAPSAASTRPTPRRISASATPRTTTIAPAPCASSTASAFRR